MSESDTMLTNTPAPMILQPIKNEALKKAEATAGILDAAEIARLKRLALDKKEKDIEERLTQYMLQSLYLPIKSSILLGKDEFIHEADYDLNSPPKRLEALLKMAQEKMPAVTFTLTHGKRTNIFWGEWGTWRITARW